MKGGLNFAIAHGQSNVFFNSLKQLFIVIVGLCVTDSIVPTRVCFTKKNKNKKNKTKNKKQQRIKKKVKRSRIRLEREKSPTRKKSFFFLYFYFVLTAISVIKSMRDLHVVNTQAEPEKVGVTSIAINITITSYYKPVVYVTCDIMGRINWINKKPKLSFTLITINTQLIPVLGKKEYFSVDCLWNCCTCSIRI